MVKHKIFCLSHLKMNIGLILFSVLFLSIQTAWGCSIRVPEFKYQVIESQVYYQDGREYELSLVEQADAASFKTNPWPYFDYYATDRNHVYYKGMALQGADPQTASLLGSGYDDANYQNDGYLKDKSKVYFKGVLLPEADANSFEAVKPYDDVVKRGYPVPYFKDKKAIYLNGKVVAGDPKSVHLLGGGYYLDAQSIYYQGEILDGALPQAFEQKGRYLVSNSFVFEQNKKLPLDGNTFEEIKAVYGSVYTSCEAPPYLGSILKDKSGIYIENPSGEISSLPGADAKTFEILSDKGWAADKARLYHYSTFQQYGETLVLTSAPIKKEKAEVTSVEYGDLYVSFLGDGKLQYVFARTGVLQDLKEAYGVDTSSFHLYAALKDALIFRDKNQLYLYTHRNGWTNIEGQSANAKQVCLETSHVCLLNGNQLSYITKDGETYTHTVDAFTLRCLGEETPEDLEQGLCFDRRFFYEDESYPLKEKKADYKTLLPYAISGKSVEGLRRKSLEKVKVTKSALKALL